METITVNNRKIPVIREVEICVVGGGPGGLGASVTAARQKRDVLLVERYGAPGGMAFWGEVTPFMYNNGKNGSLDAPVFGEWKAAILAYQPPRMRKIDSALEAAGNFHMRIPKDAAMLAAEDLMLDAGVKLLYHHTLQGVVAENGIIRYALFGSKSGPVAVKAECFIDSTGDGDLAFFAGCPFEFGNEDGLCQPMTLCFKMADVDTLRMPPREEIHRRWQAAQQAGRVVNPRHNVLFFMTTVEREVHFNSTRIVRKSAIDGQELSEAELEGRRQVRELIAFLRAEIPGFEEARLQSVAHHIGVRESRRIRGRTFLTEEAFHRRARFEDAVSRVSYNIDIHNPSGAGTRLESMPPGEWYEIPYGCIVPQKCDNLLIGSRSISVDHAIHSSMRVMPPVISLGQAAGMAAVMSLETGIQPPALDGVELRQRLKVFGACL